MMNIRKGRERGLTSLGWLESHHSFSFGDYFDLKHHQYRGLRVLNDDRIAPGAGFPLHPHRDMEILTWVISGQVEHRDSMGNGEVIRAGEWQAMTAGTGIEHSEFNPSESEWLHLLQIWLFPDREGLKPRYRQRAFPGAEAGRWQLVASPDGADGSLETYQNSRVYTSPLKVGVALRHELARSRSAYVHIATGSAIVNGVPLVAGDAAMVEDEGAVNLAGRETGEVVLFDLD
jgi:redox-sensitive bicupin YhaK (pirin superfamily)